MGISNTGHARTATSPMAPVLASTLNTQTKKADNDGGNEPTKKAATQKLATNGPGQILDRKV